MRWGLLFSHLNDGDTLRNWVTYPRYSRCQSWDMIHLVWLQPHHWTVSHLCQLSPICARIWASNRAAGAGAAFLWQQQEEQRGEEGHLFKMIKDIALALEMQLGTKTLPSQSLHYGGRQPINK